MYQRDRDCKKGFVDAIAIKDISSSLNKFNIIGIIVNKLPVRKFTKNENGKITIQAVFTFTIRDSLFDWINGSFWGNHINVNSVSSGFMIGDCVVVHGARAKLKVKGTFENDYMVQTPNEYHLVINDINGNILPFEFPDKTYTASLKCALTTSAQQHTQLNKIVQAVHTRRSEMNSKSIDRQTDVRYFTFFAAVMEVRSSRAIVTNKARRKMGDTAETFEMENVSELVQRCEVLVFDETCSRLPIVFWNDQWIHTAQTSFIPKVTILSVSDCPVRYDEYRRGVIAVPNSRTLIIVSPECPQSHRLIQYAKQFSTQNDDQCIFSSSSGRSVHFSQPLPNMNRKPPPEVLSVPLSGIHSIMTIRGIKAGKANAGYGIVFALVTKFDIDALDADRLMTLQCNTCQRRMIPCDPPGDLDMPAPGKPIPNGGTERYAMCTTVDCPLAQQRFQWIDQQHVELEFGMMISISDHTGTYHRTLLSGKAMENLIGHSPTSYLQLSQEERVRLKWNVCLQRFKIYFWIERASYNSPFPLVNVLACERPSTFEVLHAFQQHQSK